MATYSDPKLTHLNRVIRTLADPDALNDQIYADVVLRVAALKAAGDPYWMTLDRERQRLFGIRLDDRRQNGVRS